MSWEDELTRDERDEWDRFVRHFREETLQKMQESAMVMQLVPDQDRFDVKFAVELGAAVMLDKPLLAVIRPGTVVSEKMRRVVDATVYADVDTEEGKKAILAALDRLKGKT